VQKSSRARKVLKRPLVLGWKTSDEDEINVRRWRGRTEIETIEALEPGFMVFGTRKGQAKAVTVINAAPRWAGLVQFATGTLRILHQADSNVATSVLQAAE
jgi:hypothetical protein